LHILHVDVLISDKNYGLGGLRHFLKFKNQRKSDFIHEKLFEKGIDHLLQATSYHQAWFLINITGKSEFPPFFCIT